MKLRHESRLIAIMLGVLEMDVKTCINEYLDMAPKIFPKEGFVSGSKVGKLVKGLKGDARFNEEALERRIKNLVTTKFSDIGEDAPLTSNSAGMVPPSCRTYGGSIWTSDESH